MKLLLGSAPSEMPPLQCRPGKASESLPGGNSPRESLGVSPWKESFLGPAMPFPWITRDYSGLPGMGRTPFNTCSLVKVFGIGLADVIFPILILSWTQNGLPRAPPGPLFSASNFDKRIFKKMPPLTGEIAIFAGSAPSKKPTFGLQNRVKIYVFSTCFWKLNFFKFLYQKCNFWAPTWAPN